MARTKGGQRQKSNLLANWNKLCKQGEIKEDKN